MPVPIIRNRASPTLITNVPDPFGSMQQVLGQDYERLLRARLQPGADFRVLLGPL